MGIPVTDFSDFEEKIGSIEKLPSIMAFLLYTDNPNQDKVAQFVHDLPGYIDSQARYMKTYLFYPARMEGKIYRNPSMELCRIFHVNPLYLPGLLLFSSEMQGDQFMVRQAAFLPLKSNDFCNLSQMDQLFYDLANLVSPYLKKEVPVDMAALASELKEIEEEQRFPRFLDFSRRAGIQLISFVGRTIIEFAKEVAKGFAKGFGGAVGEKI